MSRARRSTPAIDRLRLVLAEPATRGVDIDSPSCTELRAEILRTKRPLREIYHDWYRALAARIPENDAPALELGAGAGFLDRYVAQLVKTDLLPVAGLDAVADAHHLPFRSESLRAIVLNNVLHHLPRPSEFLDEAERCLMPGGRLVMNEPWVTPFSRLIYTRLHHEPFDPVAREWGFGAGGALSTANGALPWILFDRDRHLFRSRHPGLRVVGVQVWMPFRYLLSGGLSVRALQPAWSFRLWRALESAMTPLNGALGLFALVTLERLPTSAREPG
jgi:SAM-dependent methyltransferase